MNEFFKKYFGLKLFLEAKFSFRPFLNKNHKPMMDYTFIMYTFMRFKWINDTQMKTPKTFPEIPRPSPLKRINELQIKTPFFLLKLKGPHSFAISPSLLKTPKTSLKNLKITLRNYFPKKYFWKMYNRYKTQRTIIWVLRLYFNGRNFRGFAENGSHPRN